MHFTKENRVSKVIVFDRFGFEVRYQPRICLATGAIVSAEALIRFSDKRGGYLPTAQTIKDIESNGKIMEFTLDLAHCVANDYTRMIERFGHVMPSVSVNLSPISLSQPGFVDRVHEIFESANICPQKIEFEITETMVENDFEMFIDSCSRVRQLGHRLSIDDFGAGSSGLLRLDIIPATAIKIDRHFVSGVRFRDTSRHIICFVAAFANKLGIDCIAEGAETVEEVNFVREAGCTEVQGYFYYPPLPFDQYMDAVQQGIKVKEAGNFRPFLVKTCGGFSSPCCARCNQLSAVA
jgi:EAL domain-containing protein (putative c-di-GMP-specific phosphodiesterase class I)